MKKLLLSAILLSSMGCALHAANENQGKKVIVHRKIAADDKNTYLIKLTAAYTDFKMPDKIVEYEEQISAKKPEATFVLDKFRTFKNAHDVTMANIRTLAISSWKREGEKFSWEREGDDYLTSNSNYPTFESSSEPSTVEIFVKRNGEIGASIKAAE